MGTVLVTGASGLVGTAAVERFLADGWSVVALSRRRPEVDNATPFRHIAVDLRDGESCRAALADVGDVTHIVYAAVYEKDGLVQGDRDQMNTNLVMLQNLLESLRPSTELAHLSLMQGTKAYGAHLHDIRVPARERHQRDNHENFYWLQEDYVRHRAAQHGWTFTIFRPQLIVGPNYGVVMNLPPVIGVYAAICREEGRAFGFPGGAPFVWEAADARLVASALAWAARAPQAAGETFNLTNGEVFEWRELWPVMSDVLGVSPGPDSPLSLAAFLPQMGDVWSRIVDRFQLRPIPMMDILGQSHYYADRCFAYGSQGARSSRFVSTVKVKQAGFADTWDTEASFVHWLEVLIDRRVLPPPA
ncbi:MAG TPA: NAD-dependent epimerase/dehydratase family protein [Candidatus Acidoferrales bacterium]|nr:NAD-dependent epimerase/dehydratase family protein [Candidatus Acidoferrales bacterium]